MGDFQIENGVLLEYTGPGGDVAVPSGVEQIGDFAFAGSKRLTAVSFPAQMRSVGYAAFYDCEGLTQVVFPSGLEQIEVFAFAGCVRLESVTFLGDVPAIGRHAFPETVRVRLRPGCKRLVLDDMAAIDRWLLVQLYLADGVSLPDGEGEKLERYIRRKKDEIGPACARSGDAAAMRRLLSLWKRPSLAFLERCLAAAASAGREETAALLLQARDRACPPEKRTAIRRTGAEENGELLAGQPHLTAAPLPPGQTEAGRRAFMRGLHSALRASAAAAQAREDPAEDEPPA